MIGVVKGSINQHTNVSGQNERLRLNVFDITVPFSDGATVREQGGVLHGASSSHGEH